MTADALWGMVNVLHITGPGTVVQGTPFQLWGLPDLYADFLVNKSSPAVNPPSKAGSQSVAFTPDGKKAYLLQNRTRNVFTYELLPKPHWTDNDLDIPDKLSWIRIDGPGQVSVGGVWVADLLSNTSTQLFGVDTLAISADGKYAYTTGNPNLEGGELKNVSRVDLNTDTTSSVPIMGFSWPMFLPAIIHGH